jgi:polyferredoxin
MDKIDLPRGLIRYSTDRAMERHWSPRQIGARILRARVLIYSTLLALIVAGVGTALALRTPLKLDVMRDRGSMGREVGESLVENVYRLQVMNTSETAHRFRIAVTGLPGIRVADQEDVLLDGATTRAVPVRVQAERGELASGSHKIEFTLTALDQPALAVQEKAVFIVPR